jgi:hypothetical protein
LSPDLAAFAALAVLALLADLADLFIVSSIGWAGMRLSTQKRRIINLV